MPQPSFGRSFVLCSARPVALLATLVAATACYSHRPTAPSQAPSGTVRVTFASPRTVEVSNGSGDVVSLGGSTEVEGRVDRVSGDTIHLRVHRARGPEGAAKGVPINGLATIVRDRDTVVERRAYNNDRTLGLVLGGFAVGFLIFAATRDDDYVTFVPF